MFVDARKTADRRESQESRTSIRMIKYIKKVEKFRIDNKNIKGAFHDRSTGGGYHDLFDFAHFLHVHVMCACNGK